MSERFERLYKLSKNLYIDEAPIIISDGALLKDTTTGNVVVQMKFHSVSPKTIKAIKLSLEAYDVSGSKTQGVNDYQYLDLNVANGEKFGSNKAIVMPSTVTRSFSIRNIVVVFADGSSWTSDNVLEFSNLPNPKGLNSELLDIEVKKQYIIETTPSAEYVPTEASDLWCCACGEWNKLNICTNCKLTKKSVFSALDTNILRVNADKRISKEQAKREEDARLAAIEEEKRREREIERKKASEKRNKLIVKIGAPILAFMLLFVFYINPYVIRYSKAINLVENQQYEEAYELFYKLKTYKNSEVYLDAFEWVCVEEYASGDYISKYEYDESGKLLRHSKQYYKYDTLDATYEYVYDDNGILSKVVEKDDKGKVDTTTTYTYDEKGNLIEEYEVWTYSEYLSTYTYDENGYVIQKEHYKRDKEEKDDFVISYKILYENDADGKVIRETFIDDGKETVYEYNYDEQGFCISRKTVSNGKVYKYSRIFDDYGRVESCMETHLDGSTQKITYQYILVLNKEKLSALIKPKEIYSEAEQLIADGQYDKAILKFKSLGDYKDSNERINAVYELINEKAYKTAMSMLENGQYEDAITAFNNLGDYKDCKEKIKESKYAQAEHFLSVGKYDRAISIFIDLGTYKDSNSRAEQAEREKYPAEYSVAEKILADGKIAEAAIAFGKLGDYSDAPNRSWKLWQGVAVRETVSSGYFATIGLKNNGTVVYAGENSYSCAQWQNIIAISGGNSIIVGLKSDGTVVVDGYDTSRYDVSSWKNIVSVSAGDSHIVGLKSDGTVVATGLNDLGECNVSEWSDIIAVSAGMDYTVGLKIDGTVIAVGNNVDKQCNVSDWENIISISAGSFHTVALKSDGSVVATGTNDKNQCNVSTWKDIISISAGRNTTIGLKKDGTVVAIGENQYSKCNVSDWSNIVAISANNHHTVGLLKNGSVVAVGFNKYSQCDVNKWTNIKVPN